MKRPVNASHSLILAMLLVLTSVLTLAAPVNAMERMTKEGIDHAIRYGMARGRFGMSDVLGPNWFEKPDGTLLNIYTPFMLLAAKVARGRHPANPTAEELKKARSRYHRTIRTIRNERDPYDVKFVLSIFGDNSKFHRRLSAHIEGIGRGHKFWLAPSKRIIEPYAQPVNGDRKTATEFAAVNAYYFDIRKVENMDELDLIIEDKANKDSEPIVFHVDMNKVL